MSATSSCDACGAELAASTEICPICGKVQQASVPVPQVSSDADALPTNFLLKQRYRIIEQIGAGGFGLVYLARDTRRRNAPLVAIKQITLAALSAQQMIEATASYNREIMLLPLLQHSSIPKLYEHFTDPAHWYIVLEYVKGQTLEEILAHTPQGHLSPERALRIGIELCRVLDYLHIQTPAIIFRDVKPANVMLTPRGKVYLIDFGIARRYRDGQSKDTVPLGSPGYAAPEQYGRAQTTAQTDIYGLGATLQTLLTGKEPWEIRDQDQPLDPALPIELQKLLTRMLEPDPARRAVRIAALRQSLENIYDTYYPSFVPTARLMVLWTLFLVLAGLILTQQFPSILQWLTLYAEIFANFYLYKALLDVHQRLNKSDAKALYASITSKIGSGHPGCLAFLVSLVLGSLLTTLFIPPLLLFIINFLCWFPALLLLSRGWWPTFARARQTTGAAQTPQAMPLPPMLQRIRKRF